MKQQKFDFLEFYNYNTSTMTKTPSYTLMLKYILKYNKKSISISVTFINAFKISKNKKDPQKNVSHIIAII